LKYAFTHANLTVTDLSRSLKFYDEALNLKEVSCREFDDCFMVYLRGDDQNFELELRVNKNPIKKINLGDIWKSFQKISCDWLTWHSLRLRQLLVQSG